MCAQQLSSLKRFLLLRRSCCVDADCAGSGVPGVSDSFEGVIQYMDSFGGLARQGLKVLARQALLGGDYELVDRDTFLPNPDYCACPTQTRCRPRLQRT